MLIFIISMLKIHMSVVRWKHQYQANDSKNVDSSHRWLKICIENLTDVSLGYITLIFPCLFYWFKQENSYELNDLNELGILAMRIMPIKNSIAERVDPYLNTTSVHLRMYFTNQLNALLFCWLLPTLVTNIKSLKGKNR